MKMLVTMQRQNQATPFRERPTPHTSPKAKEGRKSRLHSAHKIGSGSGPVFGAGETVRETGIYEVIHDGAHRSAHEVVMLNGNAFPACDTCATKVRFRLVRTAPYIFQDADFEEQD
jgi:hypothetical protein